MGKNREFDLKPATREKVPLLVGLVGPSGSGKTWSALRLASGIQRVAGGSIAVIDTEARRALHYSESFKFDHLDFKPPFGSLDYLAAIKHCVDKGARTVVIDTASLEHEGEGGLLDMHEQELNRMAGDNYSKREAMKMLAWSKPKAARRKFLSGILQLNSNLIFSFRAKSIAKPVKTNGKTEVVAMGFVPISGDELIFEMTLNMLLLPKSDGYPCWESDFPGERMAMKLPGQFRELFAKPVQLSEDIGQRLAEWAAGKPAASSTTATTAKALAARFKECRTREGYAATEEAVKAAWKALNADERKAVTAERDLARQAIAEAEKVVSQAADPSTSEPPADLFKNETGAAAH